MSKSAVTQLIAMAFVLSALGTGPVAAAPLPVHSGTRVLRSGSLAVEVGDPESAECLCNQGLRFSPVANVLCARLRGQEFLYSPIAGGALGYMGGLPMEFDIGQEAFQPDPPGYNEGKSGDPFLKVGVGILRRDGSAYGFNKSYPVIELAHTTATWHEDRVRFVQTLAGHANGYSCHLEEEVIVKNDRIIMQYLLRNTGTKPFTTEQYLHNFTCFLGHSVGPNVRVSFPYDFAASPTVAPWTPPAAVRGLTIAAQADVIRMANMLEYPQRISSVPKIWVYKPSEYAGPERFTVEHTTTEQRLFIESSIPAAYVGIWTTNYQVSPEQFVQITLAPGEERLFTRTYTFRVDGFVPQDVTGDATVDTNDLSRLSEAWLSEPSGAKWEPAGDVFCPPDDVIDLHDLAALAGQWRQEEGLPAPVAHWTFDETDGAVAYDMRGRHDAILQGFPADGSVWVVGRADGGLNFDGIDDYVEVADYAGIVGKAPRTVTVWVKVSEPPSANQAILAWGEPTPGRYWLLEVDSNRRLRFSCGEGYAIVSGRLIGDRQWHHIAVALDPIVADSPHVGDVRLYVDGRLQSVYDLIEHDIDTGDAENLRIGASHGEIASQPFAGIIDDVRIYDRALNPANIRHIYRELLPE